MVDQMQASIYSSISKFATRYKNEKIRREKIVGKLTSTGYEELVSSFYQFAKKAEDEIPYIYLDSMGFPTIGCGHLLGYDWTTFCSHKETLAVLRLIEEMISKKKLTENTAFRDFAFPEDITEFIHLEDKTFLRLYEIECVSLGLLEALDFPFKSSHGTKKKVDGKKLSVEHRIDRAAHKDRIMETYSKLLTISVLLAARKRALKRGGNNNPFSGKSFYHSNTNSLVLENNFVLSLAHSDIKVKIFELEALLNRTSKALGKGTIEILQFPLPAQKALLDLIFNGATFSNALKEAAVQQKWNLLLNPEMYGRDTKVYSDRNKEVKLLFEEASKMEKVH